MLLLQNFITGSRFVVIEMKLLRNWNGIICCSGYVSAVVRTFFINFDRKPMLRQCRGRTFGHGFYFNNNTLNFHHDIICNEQIYYSYSNLSQFYEP